MRFVHREFRPSGACARLRESRFRGFDRKGGSQSWPRWLAAEWIATRVPTLSFIVGNALSALLAASRDLIPKCPRAPSKSP